MGPCCFQPQPVTQHVLQKWLECRRTLLLRPPHREENMWFVYDGQTMTRSSLEQQRQLFEPQTCFARFDGPRLPTALYLLHLHAAGLHTVSCGTLAHLVCCCCAVPVPVLVLFIGTLSPAVVTWGCHNDNEALPKGVWYTPYPG